MRALKHHGNGLATYADQAGSVTRDPMAAYKRQRRTFERAWNEKFGEHLGRKGEMFAYWSLERKMPWWAALEVARTTAPYRVCVLLTAYGWTRADLVMPPGVQIRVEQYELMLMKHLGEGST
jgi:hypothetical protein